MATANDVISDALGYLLETQSGEPISPDSMARAITGLNDMLAEWEGGGMRLGYTQVTNSVDPVTVRNGALLTIKQCLALELGPVFGVPIQPDLEKAAGRSYRALRRQVIKVSPRKFPSTLPRGSGNQAFRYDRFYEGKNPADGLLTMAANVTATTITTAGTPVLVAGTWVVGDFANYLLTTAGRMTFELNASVKAEVTAALSIITAAGDNAVKAYIARNGQIIYSTGVTGSAGTAATATLQISDTVDLFINDYLELFVENTDTTDNLIVSDATFRVTE